jgi:RHS repeat-associated protein
MQVPNRFESIEDYRYGFNGMEKDDEIKGEGNSYFTYFREYDPRIARWLSIDPKTSKYPDLSPYVSFNNNPIFFTDPYGDDPPERLSLSKRIGNWFKGESHKNRANKLAVKNGLDVYSTFEGNVQIVANPETRESTSFVSKEFRTDFLLQAAGISGVTNFNIEFVKSYEVMLNVIEDAGGLMEYLTRDPNTFYLDIVSPYGGTFYDDVSGISEGDDIVAKISISYPVNNVTEFGSPRFRAKFGKSATNINAVYMKMKRLANGTRVPYIGKSFNINGRYTKIEASISRLKSIVSNINDKNLLRAVEQRMIDYVRTKAPNSGNVRNAMNPEKYKKYSSKVDDILKGSNWQQSIDDFFGF